MLQECRAFLYCKVINGCRLRKGDFSFGGGGVPLDTFADSLSLENAAIYLNYNMLMSWFFSLTRGNVFSHTDNRFRFSSPVPTYTFWFICEDEEDSFVMKAIIHAINDDNVPGLQHLLGSLTSYDVNQPNKVCCSCLDTYSVDWFGDFLFIF